MTILRIAAGAALLLPSFAAQADGGTRPVQRGQASYYDAARFEGRPMANGDPFDPDSDSAAHRTLPLGTVAEVTNIRTGETTRVVIVDRGPYAGRNRVIDLSPRSAGEIGITEREGVAPVEVRPVGRLPDQGRDR